MNTPRREILRILATSDRHIRHFDTEISEEEFDQITATHPLIARGPSVSTEHTAFCYELATRKGEHLSTGYSLEPGGSLAINVVTADGDVVYEITRFAPGVWQRIHSPSAEWPEGWEDRKGTQYLLEEVAAQTGRDLTPEQARTILRRLAENGKIERGTGRYSFTGPNDPAIKAVIDHVMARNTDGDADLMPVQVS